jgi:hypothetical protein
MNKGYLLVLQKFFVLADQNWRYDTRISLNCQTRLQVRVLFSVTKKERLCFESKLSIKLVGLRVQQLLTVLLTLYIKKCLTLTFVAHGQFSWQWAWIVCMRVKVKLDLVRSSGLWKKQFPVSHCLFLFSYWLQISFFNNKSIVFIFRVLLSIQIQSRFRDP